MHRSGTSLVASLMQNAGVYVGDRLLGASKGNDYGHFEDLDFLELQSAVLETAGLGILLSAASEVPAFSEERRRRAEELLEERKDRPLWGWKDPRTCLFLEEWRRLLPGARYLFVYRHPMEVALSLLRRGEDWEVLVDPRCAIAAWIAYNECLLRFCEASSPETYFLCEAGVFARAALEGLRAFSAKTGVALELDELEVPYRPQSFHSLDAPESSLAALGEMSPRSVELFETLQSRADLPCDLEPDESSGAPEEALRTRLQRVLPDPAQVGEEAYFRALLHLLDAPVVKSAGERLFDRVHGSEGRIEDLRRWVRSRTEAVEWHLAEVAKLRDRLAERDAQIEELRGWADSRVEALEWEQSQRRMWEERATRSAGELEELRRRHAEAEDR